MAAESIKKLPKLQTKTKNAIELVNQGIPEAQALQMVNGNKQISNVAIHKFKHKLIKYSLKTPGTVKKAKSQLDRILSAQPREVKQQKLGKDGQVIEYIETIAPPDSVIMSAVQSVYDRYEPAVQQNLNVSVTVDPIDLGDYLNR